MVVEIACPVCSGEGTILEKPCYYCRQYGLVPLTKYLRDLNKLDELQNVLDYQRQMSLANQQQ